MPNRPYCLKRDISLFYGWKLSWLACLGNFLLQGSAIYVMNALMEPLSASYGWSRGGLGVAMGIGSFCGVLSMPMLVSLSMRIGLRVFMVGGAMTGGLAIILMGRLTHLWAFTLVFSLLWIAGQACGGAIGNALISNWFIRYRGRAFGIANIGISLSGAVLPFLVLLLLQRLDLQTTTLLVGGTILCILVPLCWLWVRDTPNMIGLKPDGVDIAIHVEPSTPPPWSWRNYMSFGLDNRLGLIFGLGLMMSAGVVGQLKPRFSDLGFSSYESMGLMCLTALCAALGKFAWGWVSDQIPVIRTAKLLFIANIFGMGIAFLPQNVWTALIFAILCGLFLGGFWTMYPVTIAHVFGQDGFVAAYRHTSVFILLKSLGYVIMGQSYELTGSYDGAYLVFIASLVWGLWLLGNLEGKQPKRKG